MEELLKELGYTDEQIKAIIDGMKNKKIYTSVEENADLRIQKLSEDFTAKEGELTKANELIEQLQKGTEGNKELQTKITEYETEIKALKDSQHQKDIDNALKLELLKSKAKADDIDYLIFKIKSNQEEAKKIEIDDNGNLKGFKIEDLKKEFKNNFEDESSTFVDVKKLGGDDKGQKPGADGEPASLGDALKEAYTQENNL